MRTLSIDYGDARVGLAITDALGITAQGLETIHHQGNDKIVLKRLEEILEQYEIDTMDERLTTVEAHKTMNFLNINKHQKRNIVDTISAVYILESYMKLHQNK